MSRATVHSGPRGGVEYRLWTGPDTFRVVSKYAALAHMDEGERTKATAMERSRADAARQRAANDQAWRELRRGG